MRPIHRSMIFAAVVASAILATAVAAARYRTPTRRRMRQITSVCSGTWPSYWQDPAFNSAGMWDGQYISNTPASQNWTPSSSAYTNAPFRLADAYSVGRPDEIDLQSWRASRFDALFKAETSPAERSTLAHEYAWALMRYMQDGNVDPRHSNINTDWNLCANVQRQWFNMPFQTYEVLSGREFVHGLTREAPVKFSVAGQSTDLGTTVWAVAFYNGDGAVTLNKVWHSDGTASVPTDNLSFMEGTVIGKLLFTTATTSQLPFLTNMPVWTANISMGDANSDNPTNCKPKGTTMPQESDTCRRSLGRLTLLQFDFAVEDSRSPIGWVYGTFVADGLQKASEPNPWDRISLLGLMWGNDTPPEGHLASTYPAETRKNGFAEEVIDWGVVARLNQAGGSTPAAHPGHLGCNLRLNGPADNAASSCISCHMTASIADTHEVQPPLLAQFAQHPLPQLTKQCAAASAPASDQLNGVTYAQMDAIYFATTHSAQPISLMANGTSILGNDFPHYADGGIAWRSTDFSLQMSMALLEWMEWQRHRAADTAASQLSEIRRGMGIKRAPRVFRAILPRRGEPSSR